MTLTEHIQPLLDKRFPAALAMGLLVASAPAFGQGDHLFPESTLLSSAQLGYSIEKKLPRLDADYDIAVATVFHDVFSDDTVLYADVDNPLGGIRFIGLKKTKDDWRVFSLSEDVRLLRYAEIAEAERDGDAQKMRDYRGEVPPKPEDVPLDRCEKPLDMALARRIAALWDTMLRGTRYTSREEIEAASKKIAVNGGVDTVLVDGTAYHFYTEGMVGQTYNPDTGTAPALLSEIAEAMFQTCADSKSVPALHAGVTALERRLAPEPTK
jgi:hypothetical protein